jgi:hypothetical protein
MEFQISNKAKKVTLGLMGVGLLLLIVGFFFQKEYVFPTVLSDHEVYVEYWGDQVEKEADVKKEAEEAMAALGYELDFGDEDAEHESHGHDAHNADIEHSEAGEEHGETAHAHQTPTFEWHIHIKHLEVEGEHAGHSGGHGHDVAPSETLAHMFSNGDIALYDSHFRRFWSNLLVNGFFFFGIALGALFYLSLHYATESGWGVVLLRIMEAIMSALPLGMIVLGIVFIAATLGLNHIYPWMDSDVVAHDDLIWGKIAYLNKPFFWIRIICYFGVFAYFMNWFRKTSRKQDGEGVEKATALHYLMYRRGALFLVFFAVFSSTMSWDIIMSIDTHWFSTLFGWYSFSGIWLSAMIMIMMITLYLKHKGDLEFVNSAHIHDVGKWMFALSFLWSYLWFSQFMLIWYSNIPEEVIYFVTRIESYKFIFFAMFVVNFVLPMIFLMSADTKKSWPYLIFIGLVIFIGHWFDVFCMVMPGTLYEEWNFGLLEIGMFMTFLGMFIFLVLRSLGKSPIVQKNHPFLDESKHHHG